MSQNPIFGAQFAKDFWEHTNILNVLTLLPHNMSSFFILVCRISALDSEMFCLYTEHHLLHKTISRHAYVYSCIYTCITHVYTHREIERRFGDCQDSPTWIFFFFQTRISYSLWKKLYCFLGEKKKFLSPDHPSVWLSLNWIPPQYDFC